MKAALVGAVLTGLSAVACAQTPPDDDALSLGSAPEPAVERPERSIKAFVEAAAGPLQQRYGLDDETARRASLDLAWTARPASGWRTVLSDRLDAIHPAGFGGRSLINSVREAYASWQPESGSGVLEFGRINLRNGPAFGYNPTDFFREGALRAVTTADPLALRENRMGVVMARGQSVWSGGSASLAYAPDLGDSRPSSDSFSLDLGATNPRQRALAVVSLQPSDRYSGQLLGYWNDGAGSQVGASATALIGDATVAHAEWAGGRKTVWQTLPGLEPARGWRNRFTGGLTFTLPARVTLTAEAEYNGAALDRDGFDALAAAGALVPYLAEAQRRQDNAARRTYLLYVTQRGGLVKSLDMTALLRINSDDHSRFGWLEARYHWPSIDLALQYQRSGGGRGTAGSEYGASPVKQLIQLLAAYYF